MLPALQISSGGTRHDIIGKAPEGETNTRQSRTHPLERSKKGDTTVGTRQKQGNNATSRGLMALFNVAQGMAMSPIAHEAGLEAMGLWVLAGTHSSQNGTPGFITRTDVRTFTTKRKPVTQLLEAGLWEVENDGYRLRGDGEFWRIVDRSREPILIELRTAIYERDGWKCLHCGAKKDLTLDHIWPWSKGGPDTAENLQTLCRSCNSRKGAKVP